MKLPSAYESISVIDSFDALDEAVKFKMEEECLGEALDAILIFLGGDFNGHIGTTARGYDDVHGIFGFGDRNEGGTSLLDFARAFNLVIANSSFQKREEHLVTFQSTRAKTQIDYLLSRKCDKSLCTDCKVIPSENLMTQHRLNVIYLEIKRKRRKRVVYGQPKIRWDTFTEDNVHELAEQLRRWEPGEVAGKRVVCGPRWQLTSGKRQETFA
ncbi:uncharacterized protein LOC132611770 [Lycium barbarum]|uniref:uncharacterized protein LOC132611770 n=1 Tax=Lycium barbarum TaxID=112863 RepID=UPI00293EB702|nr:uncharacterized protein LOC132611770 [Lycium barbarum]